DTGRTFIYDTALPPPVAAGVLAAVGLTRGGDEARAELTDRVVEAVQWFRDAGLPVSTPAAAVTSVTAPSATAAVDWAARCLDHGVAVGCFRPPSTPDDRSRLRLTVNLGVPRADFTK